MGPHETTDEGYPVAREPDAESGYASSTDAPHEVGDEGYPEATTPAPEA